MDDFPRIPGYQIVGELGNGAVAIVYLAIQETLDRKVAVKVLEETTLQRYSQIAKRFVREAKTAASLSHYNIIQIFDAGKVDRYYYIVMEYLEESLRDRMMQAPKYKIIPDLALDIVSEMMSALDYAHLKGIFHRDIKPDNIMFREDGTPVLLDFGIARIFDPSEDLTKSKISMGTTYYMSPEQCRAQKDLDGRADVYSLGVVLFEMLTGEKPYQGETPGIITSQHLEKPIPGLPEALSIYQPLIDKMMAKNKEKRIANRHELMRLIGEIPREADGSFPATVESLASKAVPPSSEDPDFTSSNYHAAHISPSTSPITTIKSTFNIFMNSLKEKLAIFTYYPLLKKMVLGALSLVFVLFMVFLFFLNMGRDPKVYQTADAQEIASQMEENLSGGEFELAFQHLNRALVILRQLENTAEVKELKNKVKQSQEKQFKTLLNNARTYFESKDYIKAKKNISLARQIKETPDLLLLHQDINYRLEEINNNLIQKEKDDQAYVLAVSGNTIADFRKYLLEFPQGLHIEKITEKLKSLCKNSQQQSDVSLRSQFQNLDRNSVESMIKQWDFFDNIMNELGNFDSDFEKSIIGISPVVIDHKTDLIWYDGDPSRHVTFNGAEKWLKNLNKKGYGGYHDWRFPTLEEAVSLLKNRKNKKGMHIDQIFEYNPATMWTGDHFNTNNLWVVFFNAGISEISRQDKTSQVRPVRSLH